MSDYERFREFLRAIEEIAKEHGFKWIVTMPGNAPFTWAVQFKVVDDPPPPDLGVHVTDGIKPEMKRGD